MNQNFYIKKIYPVTPVVKQLVKHFWILKTDCPVSINHTLLPLTSADIIFNYSGEIFYSQEHSLMKTSEIHLSGVRTKPANIIQNGKLYVIGITFFPGVLYSILNTPLKYFKNRNESLLALNSKFSILYDLIHKIDTNLLNQLKIENYIEKMINYKYLPDDKIKFLIDELISKHFGRLNNFYYSNGFSERKVERIFEDYIGITPKHFNNISRFYTTFKNLSLLRNSS